MNEISIPDILTITKGISEVGLLIMTAAFYLVTTAIMMVMFAKQINRANETQHLALKDVIQILKDNNIKINQLKESLTGEAFNQIRVVSTYAFDYIKYQVLVSIAQIKEDNNLGNRQQIEEKVRLILDNLFNRMIVDFDAFLYNGNKLSYYTKREWIDKVFDYCIESIYDGREYHRKYYMINIEHIYDEVAVEFFQNLKTKQ